ncbi:snRNA-activating protein complex subunit 3 [Strongyloides ratti]|uniref:snRNA-activating protein complex subunit 3 n=1 Tax=Strongyloides ratti TaxID=34506 RepID=A0A090LAF6_STRRB|nr:snRNA-activating protein complex subunit 3 [Strongyloides ratti]CEF65123.1 snRNA-activating protein complex subunit 3 [Strongyloides ratti]
MSFDSFIGSKRLAKFSPVLNLNDFRYNAIYAKNLIKLSLPCIEEETLCNTHLVNKNINQKNCSNEDINMKDVDCDETQSSSGSNNITEDRCQSSLGCEEKLDFEDKFRNAAKKLIGMTCKKAPPGEIETKYKERLTKLEEEKPNELLSYNKPTIDEVSMTKYKNGFLNLISDLNGSIPAAITATNNVIFHGSECVKKAPVYSNVQLFGGVYKYKEKHSYIVSNKKMKEFRKNRNFKTTYIGKTKYFNFEEYAYDTRTNHLIDEIPDELRLTIRLYMPKVPRDIRLPYNFNAGYPVIDKVFFFCGNNTLKQLKDKMLCYWDLVCLKKEEEGEPNYTDFMMYKVPSSFIFIHDTFYIDNSRKDLTDISKEYKEFLDKRSKLYGNSKIGDMESTKLNDLNLRLGMAYVYVHMGGRCEHMFSISDVRMISYNDYHDLKTYPIKVNQPLRKKKCHVCSSEGPRYIIVECNLMPKCPKLMCEKCYKTFNYSFSIRNTDAIVYPFVDRSLIT